MILKGAELASYTIQEIRGKKRVVETASAAILPEEKEKKVSEEDLSK